MSSLDAAEATQYDRQIRLWGLEAQKRIRAARLLVFGAGGLSVETCKNLVLAGVKSLTLADDTPVTARDLTAQFFLHPDDLNKNRAEATVPRLQALNPKVEVSAVTGLKPTQLTADAVANYDVVIVTDALFQDVAAVDDLCRSQGVKFYYGLSLGFFGFFFQDLNHHDHLVEKKSVNVDDASTSELVSIDFASWARVLQHNFKGTRRRSLPHLFLVLRAFHQWQASNPLPQGVTPELLEHVARVFAASGVDENTVNSDFVERVLMSTHAELCLATAVVGGVLSGEVIKAVSGKGEPLNNCFCFDGFESDGRVFELGTAQDDSDAASSTAAPPVQEEAIVEL
ncbi:hypothetical protein PTSG_01692 [Salpingoeca rosetta]|uniref:THIF-type NAD/FAD binding fold domain-containing protein n=1 Tax=Salpingoeca rosetta (strain ATCC 50818 / BSB-021) TaxID=946362 RepID=F2TYN8_SALR5|nr:uncharacterized protein PTSG_01692 [Salpingoeca rosetta]EGD78712.1 hypothetical protein PTSG_01692 [Salpingoeca rosetta]|eukprot:XP_004997669.1 hypothetical protein PTSG_01692 [Salpingoeca rosetta]